MMALAEQLRMEGKNALSMNMKAEAIMKLTGLTWEELDKIVHEIQYSTNGF